MTTVPQRIERDALTRNRSQHQCRGNHRVAAADACEACGLRIGTELHGTLACAFDLEDAVRHIVATDISLVGSIEEDECILLDGVIYPAFQLLASKRCAGGVVGIAQVDDIHMLARQIGHEAILGRAGQIDDIRPSSVGSQRAASTAHDVGIHIDGIDGIGDGDAHIQSQQFLKVARVTLGTVANKNFVGRNVDTTCTEIVLHDCLTQEVVATFGTITTE